MIEAYCRRRSYGQGQEIELCVSTDADRFDVTIIRSGAQEVVKLRLADREGAVHPVPEDVVANGCGWPTTTTFSTTGDWKSGFYKIRCSTAAGETAEAFFVLRASSPTSSVLWVIETNTWNAYNVFGGASTYTTDGAGYTDGAPLVSFARPLPKGFISLPADAIRLASVNAVDTTLPYMAWAAGHGIQPWSGAASWSQWGTTFATWLEQEGIEVDYAINSDLHDTPEILDSYRLMLSVGHDEYWTWEMRDAVEGFVARGGNVAFLSGNTAFWQVRFEQGGEQMVAYKGKVDDDPVIGTPDECRNSGMWSHRKTGRPENHLTGLSFTRGGYARIAGATPASAGGYTIYREDHWALEGTGLSYGDQLGAEQALVGYECDGCQLEFRDGLPCPTGRDGTPHDFEVIGIAPVALWTRSTAPSGMYDDPESVPDLDLVCLQVEGDRDPATLARYAHGHAVMGSFRVPGGGTVFSGGTTEWAFGLTDPRVARITKNVIERLS